MLPALKFEDRKDRGVKFVNRKGKRNSNVIKEGKKS